ncbi:hypothetical protein [Luteimonas aestuarii]|uniref:hypothetical protein n=1 Tax=Luteimonas aestuarii TaxID=453837 RepID=UPI0014053DBA|nr:hypothetical protein [Luteimonas aestuarii]
MARPEKLQRLAGLRIGIRQMIAGMDEEITRLVNDLEEKRQNFEERVEVGLLVPDSDQYQAAAAKLAKLAADVDDLRARRQVLGQDARALGHTVDRLTAWCKEHGVGSDPLEVRA